MSIRSMIAEAYRPYLSDFDLYDCPLCDAVTPSAFCEDCEEHHCQYCLEAYGCEWCE